jgi:hypothetical protein
VLEHVPLDVDHIISSWQRLTLLRLVKADGGTTGSLCTPLIPASLRLLKLMPSLACDGASDPTPYVASGRRLDGAGSCVGAGKIQEAWDNR